jgi:hypothetical protein
MELALFTTIGGHEVIGKIVGELYDGTIIVLEHPLVVRPIEKSKGQWALDLFPHSLSDPEGEHKFYTNALVSRSVKVPEMLVKAYTERTSSIILSSALDQMERMK